MLNTQQIPTPNLQQHLRLVTSDQEYIIVTNSLRRTIVQERDSMRKGLMRGGLRVFNAFKSVLLAIF